MELYRSVQGTASGALYKRPPKSYSLRMRTRILAVALAGLLTVPATGSAQAGRAFTTDFTRQEFAARRAAVEGDVLSSDDPVKTANITGVDEVKPTDQLLTDLTARGAKVVYVPYAPTEGTSESPDGARRRTLDAAADPWDG